MTPNRKQISALPGDLFYSQVVDVNYINGLTWGRIPGVRFLYHPSEKITFGVSLENASQYFGGSGGGGTPTLPASLAANSGFVGELDQNTANGVKTPNVFPDVIADLRRLGYTHEGDQGIKEREVFKPLDNMAPYTLPPSLGGKPPVSQSPTSRPSSHPSP